jgi:hypothetical protein
MMHNINFLFLFIGHSKAAFVTRDSVAGISCSDEALDLLSLAYERAMYYGAATLVRISCRGDAAMYVY